MSPSAPQLVLREALQGLGTWSIRQIAVAVGASTAVALVIGIATVLIPNPVFGREIPPVWWNYPVLVLTSVLTGMLLATYVRPARDGGSVGDVPPEVASRRTERLGVVGTVLAWFAVGCPVCNKLALVALGYSGALTWFAPLQPLLAVTAVVLTGLALVWRLKGSVSCRVT